MRVVLLGRKPEIMMQLVAGLQQAAVEFAAGTSLNDLKVAFSEKPPSAVTKSICTPASMRTDVWRKSSSICTRKAPRSAR